jgi:hypothetical protein
MEWDCLTPHRQGRLNIHDLQMFDGAELRISIGNTECYDVGGVPYICTQTDTLAVKNKIYTTGKIPVIILPEIETLRPGCYLFLQYGDSLGTTTEYVKNLELKTLRYNEYYFSFDFSTPGEVRICVTTFPAPTVQRYVDIPEVEGVTTVPGAGKHYIVGHGDFQFSAYYNGGVPLAVLAKGFYSGTTMNLDINRSGANPYTYYFSQIVEPWTVFIGPNVSTNPNGNGEIIGNRVWSYRNTLYVNVLTEDVVSVFNVAGILYKKQDIPAGISTLTLERGVYVVTLKDGAVHKVVIR